MEAVFKKFTIAHLVSFAGTITDYNDWIKFIVKRIFNSFDVLFGANIYFFFDNYEHPFPARRLRLDDVHSRVGDE